jgi:hypothetical protein
MDLIDGRDFRKFSARANLHDGRPIASENFAFSIMTVKVPPPSAMMALRENFSRSDSSAAIIPCRERIFVDRQCGEPTPHS